MKRNTISSTAEPYYKRLILVSNMLLVTQKRIIRYRLAVIVLAVIFTIENIYLWDSGILKSALQMLMK